MRRLKIECLQPLHLTGVPVEPVALLSTYGQMVTGKLHLKT